MKRLTWTIAMAIGLASPAFAHAADAYLTANAPLMSGPDQDYPTVDTLEAGSQVSIQGCTDGWEWCDVVAYGERGWVPGNYLEFEYQNQWVLVPEYAPRYGVPIVVFNVQNYWDSYYRYRPFYARRWDWYRWHAPHHRYPRPIDVPPPHPIFGGPVHHRPMPPPRIVPLPHPIPDPPGRVVPLPHPIPNPPPRVVPLPHPIFNPPPRVVPMPHPVPNAQPASHRVETPKSEAKDKN
ncbi:MAG TPA: SH3 domain-containing protein [Xanthomonadaceae bacterium]|jgi:uncharacterized protein YraI